MEFTVPQFRAEFYQKNHIELLFCMMLLPLVLADAENNTSSDFDFNSENVEEFMGNFSASLLNLVLANDQFKKRLAEIFQEMRENGLFDGF